jgi:hypothetical protein
MTRVNKIIGSSMGELPWLDRLCMRWHIMASPPHIR